MFKPGICDISCIAYIPKNYESLTIDYQGNKISFRTNNSLNTVVVGARTNPITFVMRPAEANRLGMVFPIRSQEYSTRWMMSHFKLSILRKSIKGKRK